MLVSYEILKTKMTREYKLAPDVFPSNDMLWLGKLPGATCQFLQMAALALG